MNMQKLSSLLSGTGKRQRQHKQCDRRVVKATLSRVAFLCPEYSGIVSVICVISEQVCAGLNVDLNYHLHAVQKNTSHRYDYTGNPAGGIPAFTCRGSLLH